MKKASSNCRGCDACGMFSPGGQPKLTIVAFGFPILLFFVGVIIGNFFSEQGAIILGFGFFVLALILLYYYYHSPKTAQGGRQ